MLRFPKEAVPVQTLLVGAKAEDHLFLFLVSLSRVKTLLKCLSTLLLLIISGKDNRYVHGMWLFNT